MLAGTQPGSPAAPNSGSPAAPNSRTPAAPNSGTPNSEPMGTELMTLLSMIFTILTPIVLWCSAGKPLAAVWRLALIVSAYLYFWVVFLSRTIGAWIALEHTTFGICLALTAANLVSSTTGVVLVYLNTILSAGLFGYALAEHRQAIGTEKSAKIIKPASDAVKDNDAILHFSFLSTLVTFMFGSRLAWITFTSDCNVFLIIWELAFHVWGSLSCWILLVTQLLLKEALFSMETVRQSFYYTIFYVGCGSIIYGIFGLAGAACFFWLGALAIGALLGYSLAVYNCYKEMLMRKSNEKNE